MTRKAQLNAFLSWELGQYGRQDIGGGTGRSLRFSTAWCWQIEAPRPDPTGEVHRQIIVDGTYFGGWCVLIAPNGARGLGRQRCDKEPKAARTALFKRLPAPDIVVPDGGTGLRAAVDQQWPRPRVQRSCFHIRASAVRHTTLNPRLEAGQEVLALAREFMRVQELDAAAAWLGSYASWETRWSSFLKERTYAKTGAQGPSWAKPNQACWYTHIRLRRIQGLYRQRGPEHHAGRAVDWLLDSLTEDPPTPPGSWPNSTAAQRQRQHDMSPFWMSLLGPGLQHHGHRRGRPLGQLRLGRTPMTRPGYTHISAYNPAPDCRAPVEERHLVLHHDFHERLRAWLAE
ncbi:hypothetical protein GCM10027060_08110 [Nesterenkonia halophila]|uniref:hypothetical protein n=1 Tax=Nesterenkonia halophila TaxID=302044 RepID=UPI0012921DFC|nr:hypothetical protein [Nesterenkonia halophila]